MSALAKIKHVSSFVRTVKTVNSPLWRASYCKKTHVNGAVRGRDQTARIVEVLILDVAKFRVEMANFDFGHGRKVAKFCFSSGEFCGESLRRNVHACFAHI